MARRAHAEVFGRQAKAIELRIAGYSYEQIAQVLGFANRASACKSVNNGLRARRDGLAGEYLQLQIDRYETILRAWWDKATTGGEVKAANMVLHALERIDRLLRLERAEMDVAPETVVISADPVQYVEDLKRLDAENEQEAAEAVRHRPRTGWAR